MPPGESWRIKGRSHNCHATAEPFTDGQPIITALLPDPESSGYLRHDFSETGWQSFTPDPFSFWKHTYEASEKSKAADITDSSSTEDLFLQKMAAASDENIPTLFILAALLERQKILKETATRETNGTLHRIYENRHSSELFVIQDPNLSLDDLLAHQEKVISLLDQIAD